jgi:FkbM family methyltransferase
VPHEVEAQVRLIGHDGELDQFTTPLGQLWTRHKDRQALLSMVSEQTEGVYEVAGHGVRSGDVVLDCGANIGVYTRHALKLGARLVVAIEPAPDTLAILRRNLAAEIEARKVVVVPKGVWNQDGELKLYQDASNWSNSFVRVRSENTIIAPLTTIDHVVRDLKLDRVDFIKMDIEGAERQALNGALDTVSRFHPRMAVALEHLDRDAEEIPFLIQRLWPQVHTVCGPCTLQVPSNRFRVQPQVVAAY